MSKLQVDAVRRKAKLSARTFSRGYLMLNAALKTGKNAVFERVITA
jgi:hypothetical protein